MRHYRLTLALALFLAAGAAALAAEPAKAVKKPGSEGGRYDVLQQVYVPTFADAIVDGVQRAIQRELNRESLEADAALRKQLAKNVEEAIVQAVKQLETVSLGWRLDRAQNKTYLDAKAVALPDTDLAKRFAEVKELKTSFAGFLLPGAAVRVYGVGQAPEEQAAAAAKFVDALREREIKKIDASGASEDEKRIRKDLLNQLLDALRATAASGRSDGAASVVLSPNRAVLVAGGYLAEAGKVENVVKTVGQFLQQQHPGINVTWDAEKADGVTFHTLSLPAPQGDDREKFVQVFGESLDVVMGFGKDAAYFAAGKGALKTLKEAIAKSATPVVPPFPFEASVALKPIADFVAAVGKDHQKAPAQMVAGVLEQAKGKDHIRLVYRPIERGGILRIEAEQGVLELIGAVNPKAKEFLLGK